MYKRYERYKDSGIEWIGEIPEHWIVNKLKRLATIITGNTPPKIDDKNYSVEGIQWIKPDNILDNGTVTISKERLSELGLSKARLIPAGSALVCCIGTVGRVGVNDEDVTTNQQINSVVFNRHEVWDRIYGYYSLKVSKGEHEKFSNKVVVPILNKDNQGNIYFPVPEKHEQRVISNFLGHKTSEIDSLIADKENLIEKLKEYKQSLITEAVTKGLHPDVKMKDSGIEWIGEVPEHWKVIQIKHLSRVKRGASPRPIDDPKYFDLEGFYSWVRISDITKAGDYLEETSQKLSELGASLSVKLKPDTLFVSICATVGKPCITNIYCCIHDGFVYFPDYKDDSKFLFYIFKSGEPYKGLGKIGTQLNLNTDTIGSIYVPCPPKHEQLDIKHYLDQKMLKIDSLINDIQNLKGYLQDFRESLIFETVTGKIKVIN